MILKKKTIQILPFVVLFILALLGAGCWPFGGSPPDPVEAATQNGEFVPYVMQLQPCFCMHACLVANTLYYLGGAQWDQWAIENIENPDHSCGLSLPEGMHFMEYYPGLPYDLMAWHWNWWPIAIRGTIDRDGIIIAPLTATHVGTIFGYSVGRDKPDEFKSFICMDPAQRSGSGSWNGCYLKITLSAAIKWFPVYAEGLHGICLASRIFVPDTTIPPPPIFPSEEEFAGNPGPTLGRNTPYSNGEATDTIVNLPLADAGSGCNGECPPLDTLRYYLANKAISIALEQDTVLLPILINTMDQQQIAGIHPGPLYGVSDMYGTMTTYQGTDPISGFPRILADRGFQSYAQAVGGLGCEGFAKITAQPVGYYMQTLIDGYGNEFATALFEPIGLEFQGYSYYPYSLLNTKVEAAIPAKLDDESRARVLELAVKMVGQWPRNLEIAAKPGTNMLDIQEFKEQGLHTHLFFEWGVPEAMPFYPYVEVTDDNYNVVGIFDRWGVEYVRENGVLCKVDDNTHGYHQSSGSIPANFELAQNYPNPFNANTMIRYAVPNDGQVNLEVYNILGQTVSVLVDEFQSAGSHTVSFETVDLPSGIYFYRLTSGLYRVSRKMVLTK